MNNSITVLIPTKNRKNLLKRSIQSVLDQSVLPDEIVIVDDGSNDGTKEYLEDLIKTVSFIKVINNKESKGVNFARNKGMIESSSDWVAWLDDDDEFVLNAVETMKNKLIYVAKDLDVINFNTKIIRNSENFYGGYQFKNENEFVNLNYGDWMSIKSKLRGDCKPVFRKSLFQNKKYLFPETVNGFESYTLNLIARDKNKIRCYRDITTIIHQEIQVGDRLSLSASARNPWPLFVLHFKQIFEHFRFYTAHPILLFRKKIEMLKLLARSILALFNIIY